MLGESQSIDAHLPRCSHTQAARLYAQADSARPACAREIGTAARVADGAEHDDLSPARTRPLPDVQVKPPHSRPFSAPRAVLPCDLGRAASSSWSRRRARRHPQALIAHQDAKWWTLSHYDSAVVSNAEGTKVAWYQRRPEQVRAMLARSARTHLDLYRHWNRLRDRYRAAAGEITSFPAWEATFAANPAPVRPGIDDRDGAEGSARPSDAPSESASA